MSPDKNGHDTITSVIFQGIATITIDMSGTAYDVALTARTEYHGYVIRWFGTFEWMGEKPANFISGGFFDIVLSDGREARIRVPHPSTEANGQLEFLGVGLPPGFEVFTPEHMQTVELKGSTPSRVSSFVAMLLFIGALTYTTMAIWEDHDQWRYAASALLLGFISLCVAAFAGAKNQATARRYAEGGEILERDIDNS